MSANSNIVTKGTTANSLNTDSTASAAPASNIPSAPAPLAQGATGQNPRVLVQSNSKSVSPTSSTGGSPVMVSANSSPGSQSPIVTPVGGPSSRKEEPSVKPLVPDLTAYIRPDATAAESGLQTGEPPKGSSPISTGLPPHHPTEKATSPTTNSAGEDAIKNSTYKGAAKKGPAPETQNPSGAITPAPKSNSPTGTFSSTAAAAAAIHTASSANTKGAAGVQSHDLHTGTRRFSTGGKWADDIDPHYTPADPGLNTEDGHGPLHTGSESGGSSPVTMGDNAQGSPVNTGSDAVPTSASKTSNKNTSGSGGNAAVTSATTSAGVSASAAEEPAKKGSGDSTSSLIYVSVRYPSEMPEGTSLKGRVEFDRYTRGKNNTLHPDISPGTASPSATAAAHDGSPRSDSSSAELREIGPSYEEDNSPPNTARGKSMLEGKKVPTMHGVPVSGGIFAMPHSANPELSSAATATATASAAASMPGDTKFAQERENVQASNILQDETDIGETIKAIKKFINAKIPLEKQLATLRDERGKLTDQKKIQDKQHRIRLIEHQIGTVNMNIRFFSQSIPATHQNQIPPLESSAGSAARQPLPPGNIKLAADNKPRFNFKPAHPSSSSAAAAASIGSDAKSASDRTQSEQAELANQQKIQNEAAQNELRKLKETVQQLQKAETDKQAALEQLQKEKTELASQQEKMQIELQKIKENAEQLEKEKATLANEKATLTKERDSASQTKVQTEVVLQEKQKQLSDLAVRLTAVETAFVKTSSECSALHSQLQVKEQEVTQKTQQINHMQTQRAADIKDAHKTGGEEIVAGIKHRQRRIK